MRRVALELKIGERQEVCQGDALQRLALTDIGLDETRPQSIHCANELYFPMVAAVLINTGTTSVLFDS